MPVLGCVVKKCSHGSFPFYLLTNSSLQCCQFSVSSVITLSLFFTGVLAAFSQNTKFHDKYSQMVTKIYGKTLIHILCFHSNQKCLKTLEANNFATKIARKL